MTRRRAGGAGAAADRPAVLLAIDSLDVGGAERHVVDLARALRRRGHRVDVACSAAGPLRAELDVAGIPVHVLAPGRVKRRACIAYAERLRELVLGRRPDVVHAHLFATGAAVALGTVGLGVPLVVTEQTEAPWRSPRDEDLSRFTYDRASAIVAVSSPIRERIVTGLGARTDKVLVIPNAVLPPRAGPPPSLPSGCTRPRAGMVARLVPEKGVPTFVRAAARTVRAVPGASFVLAGEGPLRAEVERLRSRLGVERLHLLGARDDARALIGVLDVLAVPSVSEGTPLVVAEALQAGTPVVATPVGGIPEQLDHGCEGLLVPVGDDAALARALLAVLTRPELAARLRAGARRRATRDGHAAMVSRLVRLYRDVLREAQPIAVPAAG